MPHNDLGANKRRFLINPPNEDCMGEGENCEEDQVGSDPILVCGHCPHEGGNPGKKDQCGKGKGAGEEEELGNRFDPRGGKIRGGKLIAQGTESQKVAPRMKGHEVYSNGE